MRTILLALFLLSVSVSCSLPFFTYEDDVVVLTDENYEQALYEFDYALIEFYAPWCGHCKTLAPQFAEAAKQLAKTNPEVKLCKVDATKEVKFAKKYEIRGYPTLYFFVKGRKSPLFFHHNKNAQEIVEWVQRKATIASEAIKSLEDAEKFIDSNEVALIFFGDSTSEAFKGYLETANNFDGVVFGHTNDDQVREKYEVQVNENSPETIVLFKKFDEGKNYFNGPFDFESIVNFIEKNRFPLVFPFDHRFSRKIFGDGNDVLFLVTDKQEAGVAAEEIFRQIATEIKGKIVFCLARIEEPMVDMLMGLVGVSKEELPAIRIMQPSQRNQKYAMNSEINGENIKKFVEDFIEKRLPVYFKSEPIPENSYEDDVRIVVGKDFKEVVLDENKDVLMVYYAPLCSPCKEMAPTYASLAASLKNVEGLVIGKMDLTKNEAEGLKTQGFPTIRFYPKGNKSSPIDFPGERTEEGFLDFLKKHTTLPIEKLEKPTDIEL